MGLNHSASSKIFQLYRNQRNIAAESLFRENVLDRYSEIWICIAGLLVIMTLFRIDIERRNAVAILDIVQALFVNGYEFLLQCQHTLQVIVLFF